MMEPENTDYAFEERFSQVLAAPAYKRAQFSLISQIVPQLPFLLSCPLG